MTKSEPLLTRPHTGMPIQLWLAIDTVYSEFCGRSWVLNNYRAFTSAVREIQRVGDEIYDGLVRPPDDGCIHPSPSPEDRHLAVELTVDCLRDRYPRSMAGLTVAHAGRQ